MMHGKVQQMSTKIQQQIEWHRARVMELLSKGKNNQSEMQGYCNIDELLSRVQIKFYQL